MGFGATPRKSHSEHPRRTGCVTIKELLGQNLSTQRRGELRVKQFKQ